MKSKQLPLRFTYSLRSEIRRVNDTIEDLDWLNQRGYRPIFPSGYTASDENFKGIEDQVAIELKSPKIDLTKKLIASSWKKHWATLDAFLNKVPYNTPDFVNVMLTKYGVGGSYWQPNLIIINVNNNVDLFKIVVHELIHCIIETPVVEKYNLDAKTKEGLVDWLFINEKNLAKLFPNSEYQHKLKSTPPTDAFLSKIGWDTFIS